MENAGRRVKFYVHLYFNRWNHVMRFLCICVKKIAPRDSSGPKRDQHVMKCYTLSFSLVSAQSEIKLCFSPISQKLLMCYL